MVNNKASFSNINVYQGVYLSQVFLYDGSLDQRFILDGDLWINNIMVNEKTNKAKILDWQTLCPGHPVFDLIFLLCTSVTHENLDSWTDDLINIYMEAFKKTCLQFNIESPFQMKEFNRRKSSGNFFGV